MLPLPPDVVPLPASNVDANSWIDDQLGTHEEAEVDDVAPYPFPPPFRASVRFENERLADVGLKSPPPPADKDADDDNVDAPLPVVPEAFGRRLRGRAAAASPSGGLAPEDENIGEKKEKERRGDASSIEGKVAGISDWAQREQRTRHLEGSKKGDVVIGQGRPTQPSEGLRFAADAMACDRKKWNISAEMRRWNQCGSAAGG